MCTECETDFTLDPDTGDCKSGESYTGIHTVDTCMSFSRIWPKPSVIRLQTSWLHRTIIAMLLCGDQLPYIRIHNIWETSVSLTGGKVLGEEH